MIDVNWDLAPEGAKELRELIGGQFLRWFNGDGKAWDGYKWFNSIDEYKTIATRPTQTKTVADAVEAYNGVWPEDEQPLCCYVDYGNGDFKYEFWQHGWFWQHGDCYEVCTREQFEAYVKEQEGEKWTHIDAFGDPCRILIEEKDNLGYVVILRQSGHYATPAASSLKPIKPTIDESQAWVKMQSLIPKHGVTAAYQMTIQQYEII